MLELFYNLNFWLIVLSILGVLQMAYIYWQAQTLKRRGIRVIATVLDKWSEEHGSPDPGDASDMTSYYVKAYFDDENDMQQVVEITVSRAQYKKSSDHIPLIYLPGKPKRAKVNSNYALYSPMILGGIVFLLCAIVLIGKTYSA